MTRNAKERSALAEAIASAANLRELGDALTTVSRRLVGVSSMCFLPFGRDLSSMSNATLFHEQHSSEHMLAALIGVFPVQQRELGDGGQVATQRLFGLKRRVVDLNALYGPEGLERTQSFNEFWRPCHVERQLFAPLTTSGRPLGYLCLARAASEPAFGDADREWTDWLSRRAVAGLRRVQEVGNDSVSAVLDALRCVPTPSALFDSSGGLLWISSAAERTLGIRLVEIGCTQLVAPTSTFLAWQAAAQHAFQSPDATTQRGDLLLQRINDARGPLVLVTQSHADRRPALRVDRVQQCWRLTAREAEVLSELAGGGSNKEIAAQLGCSTRTVEVHVSSLLLKGRCTTRTELLARLWAES